SWAPAPVDGPGGAGRHRRRHRAGFSHLLLVLSCRRSQRLAALVAPRLPEYLVDAVHTGSDCAGRSSRQPPAHRLHRAGLRAAASVAALPAQRPGQIPAFHGSSKLSCLTMAWNLGSQAHSLYHRGRARGRLDAGTFISELKRRRVFRVLIGYGVVTFALL